MDKLRAAAVQALEALGTLDCGDSYKTHNAATALREALDHSGESNEMVAESVVKKSLTTDLMVDALTSILEMDVKGHALRERLQFSTLGRKLLDKADKALATVKKSLTVQEQEPVAWMFVNDDGECEEIGYGKEYLKGSEMMADFQPLYAAPVRTKDLTEDEIIDELNKRKFDWVAVRSTTYIIDSAEIKEFARAVIQEYRRKNGIV